MTDAQGTFERAVVAAWNRHGTKVLWAACLAMGVAAAVWLGYGGWRLVHQSARAAGAQDLLLRQQEVRGLFAGEYIYRGWRWTSAVYPPASYVVLWPFVGWCDMWTARWLWLLTAAGAATWLARLLARESGARSGLEKTFTALLPLCAYGAGTTVGNGQLLVHALPCLLAGILLFSRAPVSLGRDLLGAALVLFALAKPSAVAPFVWIVVWVPRRWRPILLVVGGYALLTWFGSLPQHDDLVRLLRDWLQRGREGAVYGASRGGVANLHTVQKRFGFEAMAIEGSLVCFGLLGAFVLWQRKKDIWLLLGVAAFVARFWTYHRWFDDLLLVLPQVALARLLFTGAPGALWHGTLLAAMTVLLCAPGGRHLLAPEHLYLYQYAQALVWLATFVLLVWRTVRSPARALGQPA